MKKWKHSFVLIRRSVSVRGCERRKISNRWRSLLFLHNYTYIIHDCMRYFFGNENMCVLGTSPPKRARRTRKFISFCACAWWCRSYLYFAYVFILVGLTWTWMLFVLCARAWECLVYNLKLLQDYYSCINCHPLMYSPNWMPLPQKNTAE